MSGTPSPLSRSPLVSAGAGAQSCAGFVDVPASDGFCPNVEWLKNRSITLGCTDTTHYCPTASVTRLAMAAFMNRLGTALTPTALLPGRHAGRHHDLVHRQRALRHHRVPGRGLSANGDGQRFVRRDRARRRDVSRGDRLQHERGCHVDPHRDPLRAFDQRRGGVVEFEQHRRREHGGGPDVSLRGPGAERSGYGAARRQSLPAAGADRQSQRDVDAVRSGDSGDRVALARTFRPARAIFRVDPGARPPLGFRRTPSPERSLLGSRSVRRPFLEMSCTND